MSIISVFQRGVLPLFILLLSTALIGCGESVDIDQAIENVYEGKGIKIAETANYVYIERPLEALPNEQLGDGYQFAVQTVTDAIAGSDVTVLPGAETIIDTMYELNLGETLDQLGKDLDEYQGLIQGELGVATPPVTLTPSGVMVFLGFPISGSAAVGASASITALIVFKLYKVTRIDKQTGEVDEAWHRWTYDAADGAIIKGGVGVGAGGGVGVHFGLGLIWGELERPDDFRGQTAAVVAVPFAGGLGPIFQAGVRWDNVIEDTEPNNFFVMGGLEFGATAKLGETHIQGGNVTDLWNWVANTLGFNNVEDAGGLAEEDID
jgi:hypothetical protein